LLHLFQVDARSSTSGEIIFKDNFSQAVAGIVEVICTLHFQFLFCRCFSPTDYFTTENLVVLLLDQFLCYFDIVVVSSSALESQHND